MEREQKLCQRCEGSSVDDVEHVIFLLHFAGGQAAEAPVIICTWKVYFMYFFEQDPNGLAAMRSREFGRLVYGGRLVIVACQIYLKF